LSADDNRPTAFAVGLRQGTRITSFVNRVLIQREGQLGREIKLNNFTPSIRGAFPRKRIFTTILNIRRNLLHCKVEVGRLAGELAV